MLACEVEAAGELAYGRDFVALAVDQDLPEDHAGVRVSSREQAAHTSGARQSVCFDNILAALPSRVHGDRRHVPCSGPVSTARHMAPVARVSGRQRGEDVVEGDRLTGAGCMRCLLGAPERDSGMVLELLLVESKGGEILGERELSSSLDLAGQHGQRRCDARPERCSAGSACLLGHGGDYGHPRHQGHSGNQAAQTARRSPFSDSVCCSKAFDKCAGTSVRHRAPRRRLCGQFEHEDLLGLAEWWRQLRRASTGAAGQSRGSAPASARSSRRGK